MAYIANKPVRFDRNYAIGEVIPEKVIDPKMTRRLVEMGRIIRIDHPEPDSNPGNPPAPPQNGAESGTEGEGGTNTQGEPEAPPEGAESGTEETLDGEDEPDPEPEAGGEFVCPDCGRTFGSKNALSAHSRTHKE